MDLLLQDESEVHAAADPDPQHVLDDIAALMAIPVVGPNAEDDEKEEEEDRFEEEPQPPLHIVISMEERIRALEQSLKQQKELCEELQRSALLAADVNAHQHHEKKAVRKAGSSNKRAAEGEGSERKVYRVSEARAYVTANIDDPKVAEKLVSALGDDIVDPPPRCLIRAFLHARHKKLKTMA